MAEKTRLETQSTDFFANAGWSAALAADDDLGIGYDTGPLTAGLTSVTSFSSMVVQNGVDAPIGEDGSPLEIKLDGSGDGRFQYLGEGDVFIEFPAGCRILEWSPSSRVTCTVSDGSVVVVRCGGGSMIFGEDVDFDAASEVDIGGGDVTIEADAGGTDVVVSIFVSGGTLVLRRRFTSLRVCGRGRVVHELGDLTGGDVEIDGPDAVFQHISGCVGDITGRTGLLDNTRLVKSEVGGDLVMYEGFKYARAVGEKQVAYDSVTELGRGANYMAGKA